MIWTWSTVINVTVYATPAEAFVRFTIFGCADSKMNDESLEQCERPLSVLNMPGAPNGTTRTNQSVVSLLLGLL